MKKNAQQEQRFHHSLWSPQWVVRKLRISIPSKPMSPSNQQSLRNPWQLAYSRRSHPTPISSTNNYINNNYDIHKHYQWNASLDTWRCSHDNPTFQRSLRTLHPRRGISSQLVTLNRIKLQFECSHRNRKVWNNRHYSTNVLLLQPHLRWRCTTERSSSLETNNEGFLFHNNTRNPCILHPWQHQRNSMNRSPSRTTSVNSSTIKSTRTSNRKNRNTKVSLASITWTECSCITSSRSSRARTWNALIFLQRLSRNSRQWYSKSRPQHSRSTTTERARRASSITTTIICSSFALLLQQWNSSNEAPLTLKFIVHSWESHLLHPRLEKRLTKKSSSAISLNSTHSLLSKQPFPRISVSETTPIVCDYSTCKEYSMGFPNSVKVSQSRDSDHPMGRKY